MAGTGKAAYEDDQDGAGAIVDINVTPLVDITLVLLIIMMVAAPLIVNNPSFKMELPKASQGDETQRSTIALTLLKDGNLYFGEEKVTEQVAQERVRAEAKRVKEVQAVIAADRGVPYGSVIRLIDLVKSEGVTRFALNIDASP